MREAMAARGVFGKRRWRGLAFAALLVAIGHAQAVTNCGDLIGVDAPGQYGRIDIHSYLQAALHARQPVIHALSLVADHQRPICLSVWPQQQANGSAIACSIEQASRGSTEFLEQRRHLGLARKGAP